MKYLIYVGCEKKGERDNLWQAKVFAKRLQIDNGYEIEINIIDSISGEIINDDEQYNCHIPESKSEMKEFWQDEINRLILNANLSKEANPFISAEYAHMAGTIVSMIAKVYDLWAIIDENTNKIILVDEKKD